MTFFPLRFMVRSCTLSALPIRRSTPRRRQFLRHYDFCATRSPWHYVKFVHEGAHQEDPASGSTEQIFFRERIRHVCKFETRAFIQNVNDHLIRSEVYCEVNFLFRAFLVSIVKCIDHAFEHAHPNAVALVLTEPCGFRHPETHLLREIDAFDLRLQRNFKMLGVRGHLYARILPQEPLM